MASSFTSPSPAETQIITESTVNATHLIIVACHAIYIGKGADPPNHDSMQPTSTTSTDINTTSTTSPTNPSPSDTTEEDSQWLIAPFQHGETRTFLAHARLGLETLAKHPEDGLLVFSGSSTRPETRLSEARSYLEACRDHDFFQIPGFSQRSDTAPGRSESDPDPCSVSASNVSLLHQRIRLDEQALDSYGNMLYPLQLFWRATGATAAWPARITVVGHEFKRARFMQLHVPALRLGGVGVEYLGVDPEYMQADDETDACQALSPSPSSLTLSACPVHPPTTQAKLPYDAARASSVREGERARGYEAWRADPHGVGTGLRSKKRDRNPWGVGQSLVFASAAERARSGVRTRIVRIEDGRRCRRGSDDDAGGGESGDGGGACMEVLEEMARQPWEVVL